MFPYFLGIVIIFPIASACFFLLAKNSRLHRAAVYFMAAVLLVCAGWALAQGRAAYLPDGLSTGFLGALFGAANGAVLIGMGYWNLRRKDWMQGALTLAQGMLFGCFLWQAGGVGGPGSFVLDHLSGFMLLLVDGVGPVILVFSVRYMNERARRSSLKNNRQPLFYALAALLLGAMNGLILANHLLWVLFFWQAAVLSSSLLIAHDRTQLALKNARHFVGVCSVGSVAFMAGILLVFSAAGTLLVSELLMFKEATRLLAPFSCFVVAGMVVSGQFPFQSALVRSITSPTPVSALLQSSTTVIAGVYLILRLSPVFMNTWLAHIVAVIGAFSFAASALLASMQHASRRVLAYTTISSMGLAISLACFPALQAIYAAVLLIVLHGVSKALLLLCVGNPSRLTVPLLLTLLAGASMIMPPFGIPIAQWTAMEASVRNPPAFMLILAGIIFTMIFWTRFIGERLPAAFSGWTGVRVNLLFQAPQFFLAAGVALLSIFLVPIANHSVAPILRENYGRFDDIAQGEMTALLVRNFSGIDPMLSFAALGLIFSLGWVGVRAAAGREVATTAVEKAEPGEVEAEKDESMVPVAFLPLPLPHCNVFSIFPDVGKTSLYATIAAGALVILMLEVVFR